MAYDIAFVIEQALGHVTHAKNLQANVPGDSEVRAHWVLPQWETEGLAGRLPVYNSNWTVRAGWQARRGLAQLSKRVALDALFFHTQVPAVLASDWLARIPGVISLDATPLQYDDLGDVYAHEAGPEWLEKIKWRLNVRALRQARRIVTWSEWAKEGLVRDYEVPTEKVVVIPPGVNSAEWARPRARRGESDGPVRLLFVGGDLQRKGGELLLEAFRALREEGQPVELHLVTRTPVAPEPGLFVYNDMQPNSDRLRRLYFNADVFCLPTYGDCLPMVLSEAGAAGLPSVSTAVAAIPEIVQEGETGFVVPVGDAAALTRALRRLVGDKEMRRRMGASAAERVRAGFDAPENAERLLEVLKEVARSGDRPQQQGWRGRESDQSVGQFYKIDLQRSTGVLLTVSGEIPQNLEEEIEGRQRPLTDYVALAAGFDADLIDYALARRALGPLGWVLERLGLQPLALAWSCFRLRQQYETIVTDGEQIGIPLALLLKLFGGRRRPRHVMISHILSVGKKQLFFDLLGLQSHVATFVVYSSWQKRFIEERWNVPPQRVLFTPFMVDAHFFSPQAVDQEAPLPPALSDIPRPFICAVGLEFRDYPTLLEAVRDLEPDVHVVIAAASPWSRREDTTEGEAIPANVTVRCFSQFELRRLYQMSEFVVMPLFDVNFQAGITAILEAMAMGRALICSRTPGQTDVIRHGENGLYVPPEDPVALQEAILQLLAHPEEAQRMGRNARELMLEWADLPHYVQRLTAVVYCESGEGA